MTASTRLRLTPEIVVAVTAITLEVLAAALTLHGAYSAFTWGKFKLIDYGRYVNMVWNCGHGRPFTMLVDQTYLSRHLSFTLALLGPFFWIWDHPFLLAVLQWLSLIGGTAILWRTAVAHQLRSDVTAAIALFFVANPFTQAVMLSEFHGVGLYFLLMPWLHACLDRRKKSAWLPLLLLLGLREEVGVLVLPLLVYFAVRDRWRSGWVLAGLSLGYALVALEVLFPLVGGMEFAAARGDYVFDPHHYLRLLSLPELWTRAAPLVTCLLVVTPFLLRDWRAIVVFPLTAVLIAATAAEPNIYLLRHHYPAAIIVLVTLGVLETVIRSPPEAVGARLHARYALFLIAATLAWHRMAGFLPYGGRYDRIYGIVHPAGEELLRVAREIPKDGVLLCPSELAGFCANRADLLTWESFDDTRHRPDLVFVRLKDTARFRGRYRAMLESGEFGVRYFDHGYAIFERGHSGERNAEVLRMVLPQDGVSPASAKPRLSVQASRKPTSALTSMASNAKRNAQ